MKLHSFVQLCAVVEGSLEVKLPTIWTDEKQSRAEAERRERLEERRSEKRKSQKKEDADARKGRKVAKHCVFPMICGSEGRKVGSLKCGASWPDERWKIARRCGAKYISKSKCTKQTILGPLLEVEMSKKCTPLWREAHFEVKMYKTPQLRTTFGSWDVEKVHAVVARSTFRSQNVQNTSASDHFWKLRCRKSARRCGAKHISKSKVQKTEGYGVLLDVQMSFCVVGARDCAPCEKWAKREGFVAVSKTLAGVGHLKRICKDAFRVAGAVQETCSSEMSGSQGADFLRGVPFWSLRSSGLLRWFCVTGAALRMTWH